MFTRMMRLFHKVIVLQIIKPPSHNLTRPSLDAFRPLTFVDDGTGPADESKRTKRVQGWSHQIMGGRLLLFAILPVLLCEITASFA